MHMYDNFTCVNDFFFFHLILGLENAWIDEVKKEG